MRRVIPKSFPRDLELADASAVALFVRAARTQSGLTLEEAALATGVAKSTLQTIETDPSTVSLGLVLKVARELGVSFFAVPSGQRKLVPKLADQLASQVRGLEQDSEP